MNMLLIGKEPGQSLGYHYVQAAPYDGVVIGSLELSELLYFSHGPALEALAEGKPVVLYTPGLPRVTGNRALAATLTSRQREMKSWGVVFTNGGQRRVITGEMARQMRLRGERPGPGAVMTPLAKEILQ